MSDVKKKSGNNYNYLATRSWITIKTNLIKEVQMMKEIKNKTLLVHQQEGGFVCQIEENNSIISSQAYNGAFPRIDIWLKAPAFWLWLLDNGLLDVERTSTNKPNKLMLSIDYEEIDGSDMETSDVIEKQSEFIMTLIDMFELSLDQRPTLKLRSNDAMRLDALENICHNRHINLYDFFIALEKDRPLMLDAEDFKKWRTNAKTYYKAITILLNVEGVSIKELSRRTGIYSENLMSDRSEALRGKNKTMSIKSLYLIAKALNLSISTFLVLCMMIQNSNLYEIFAENKHIPCLK